MATLEAQIEALLAVSPRPLNVKKISELTGASKEDVRQASTSLADRLKAVGSGITLVHLDDELRFGSSPEVSGLIESFVKDETTGELTRPQLETLTVIAYRGPITKAELEQVRGVNCTMIIRNLLMRGLIDEAMDSGIGSYSVSMEFLSFLGASNIAELPDYEALRRDKRIEDILELANKEKIDEKTPS